MFRRSRFSIRPNVGTAGRTAATPQEASAENQETSETPKDSSDNNTATAVIENKSLVIPSEKPADQGDSNDQNGESANSSAAVQRRKRFSVKPKVAPGRPSILSRTTKSPVKAVPEMPVKVPESDHDTPATTSQSMTTVAPKGLHSPRRRRPSEESKQPRVQPKQNLIPSDSSGLPATATAEDSLKTIHQSADSGKYLESASGKQIKEAPCRLSEKVPPSLPDKEAIEISEKAKTLVSSKIGHSPSPAAFCLSRLLNDPSDLQRLAKARKLRELLREEMHKEKKIKKSKMRAKAFTLDPAKMTMRDLIHYLPESNPMTSRLEDPTPEDETVVPPSPCRQVSPERALEPAEVRNPSEADEEEAAEEDQEEAFLVPQVKVAEDGSLIIDEESLTVEVNRAKGPNPAQDRDPIFERGSTTTYSSFRKGTYSKPWSSEETDMFFLAISMVGTDFTMICQLFPHRARSEIKNKFKKEERENAWRIDKAFRERRKLDIEYFSKLLEKILEVQKNRKKLKALAEKNCPKKYKRRAKGKKVARKLSDVEEEEEDDMPDLEEEEEEEEEGEKENEDLCNEGQTPLSKPKNKRKRTNGHDATTNKSIDQKNQTNETSMEQGIDYTHEDPEAALPENSANSDMCGKTENSPACKYTAVKPAKLTRGTTPQPLLHLGRELGKKAPSTSAKTKDTTSDKEDESVNDGAIEEQVNKDESAIKQGSKRKLDNDDISSEEEEDITSQPLRPTRYGRMPKPTKPLTYPAKEDTHSSASETTPASPPGAAAPGTRVKTKCTTKKKQSSRSKSVQQSKKPKLVTLRASQSEYSDDEDGVGEEQHPACSSSISAFVPASLCSLHPVSVEVEETMEEFDILVNMPDVLGISQDALYPDVTCKKTQNETTEPCEHQLDQLVDVMECLASEYTVSEEESYNEAAQTLLTISNLAHVTQSAQKQTIQDQTTGTEILIVDETRPNIEQDIVSSAAQEENAHVVSATSFQGVTETVETVANMEPQNSPIDNGDMPMTVMSDQKVKPSLQLLTIPENSERISSQTRRGRLPKMKAKPNISQALRTGQSKSQPEASVGTSTVESHTVAPSLSKCTESPTVAEVTPANADLSQKPSTDEMSSTEAGVPEAASGTQEMSVDQITGAATSDHFTSESQSHCLSETRVDPSSEQTSRESTDETLLSEVKASQSSYLVNPDTAVTELPRTNIDRIQQSNDEPGPSHMLLKELPLTQKEESEVRESQSQEVNTNLTKALEAVHVSQTTKYSNPTPSPNEKSTDNLAVIESESTCISLPATNQNTGLDFDSVPSSDVDRTEELPTSEDRKTDEVFSEVHSRAALSDQSTSENGCVPEATKDASPQSESVEENIMSQAGTVETSLGPGSYTESATAQESRDHSAPFITHVEELPVCQKEERALASTCPPGKRQFYKVKPKPNIALTSRTVRSKSVTEKDTIEQNSNQSSNPQIYKKATVEGEAEPLLITSAEKVNQIPDPVSGLIPIADINTSLTPTEELPTTEEKETAKESSTDQCVSENTNFSENQFDPSGEEAIRDTSSTTAEKLMSDAEILDSAETLGSGSITDTSVQESSHPALNIPHMEEIPASQKEEIKVAPACQARKVIQSLRTVQCKPQSTVEPVKPMVVEKTSSPTSGPLSPDISVAGLGAQPTCTAILPGKPNQITGTPFLSVFSCELSSTQEPAEDLSSTEGQKTDVTNSEVPSSKNLPQRRRRFSRVKPNLGSSSRNTVTKLQPGDDNEPSQVSCSNTSADVTLGQQPVNNDDAQNHLQLKEKNTQHLTSTHCSQQLISSTNLAPANSEKLLDDTNDGGTTSDGVAIAACLVAENQHVWTGSAVESESCEKPALKVESTGDLVAAVFVSQWDCKQDTPAAVAETNAKAVDNPTAIPDIQSSENGTAEAGLKLTVDPKESTQQPSSENASGLKSQDAITQSSETAEANPAAQSTHDSKSELTSSSESSRKTFPTRRGRLVKPKPNLGHSSRPKQIQNITQAGAGSVAHSEDGDAGISRKPPVSVEPVEGATEQKSSSPPHNADSSLQLLAPADEQLNRHSPPNVPGSSLGCSTHVDNNYTQDGAAFSESGNHSQASLSIFSHMIPEQVPSDPDEPFFILSLTEIPVYSMGEMGGSTAEPLPGVAVTELSVQNQSVAEDVLVAAEDGPLANVTVSEGTVETDLMSVKEIVPGPAAYKGSNLENPVAPYRVENSEETGHPPTKETKSSSHEASTKKQFKPKTQRKKQDSKSLAAESISSEILEQPGLPVEPKTSVEVGADSENGSGDHVNITMVAPVAGKNPEETKHTIRKRKGSTSTSTDNAAPCDSPPGTAASKRQKVKTPCRAEKPSTSHDIAPTPTQIQPSQETHSAPSAFSPTHAPVDKEQTASCSQPLAFSTSPAEFSAFQESDSKEHVSVQEEEQPTSVSQYFLSDIFTEVEDD